MSIKKTSIWLAIGLAVLAGFVTAVLVHRRRPVTLRGAVLREDSDSNKQLPVADVQVTATNGLGVSSTKTDSSGYFSLTLPKGFRRRQPVQLRFRHPNYRSLDLDDYIGDKIYLARMVPVPQQQKPQLQHPDVIVTNTRVRYSVKATTEADVGNTVKTFQVVNTGNIPCNKQPPCSPDGKWKAALASTSLDAGERNQFRNARISCIAGPCPFTKVELEDLSQDGRYFQVSVLNWSDTTTFLMEAEVVHPMVSDLVRESYPVIFGRALNFSLPIGAEGPSIQAELDGQAIVFPLGPDLLLRWADCHLRIDKDQLANYRCELKPGYQFR